jgi:hypothetical protein
VTAGHRRDRLAPETVFKVMMTDGTQRQVALACGVSVRSVQRIQAGTHPGVKR